MWLDKSRCLCLVCSLLPMRRQYRPLDTRYSTLSFIFSYNLLKDHYFGFYIKKEFSLDTLFTAEKFNDRIIWGFFFFLQNEIFEWCDAGRKIFFAKKWNFNNYGNVEPQKSTTPYESRSPITHSPSPVHPDWGTPVLPAIRSSDPLIAPDRQVQGLNPVTPHCVTVSPQNVPLYVPHTS